VIYRRRGLSPERWSLPLDEPAVLSGAFVLDTGRGRRETLTFGPADRCRYQFADQRLTLTSGTVTRRFLAQLWFTPEGWRLRLECADDDRPRPANDLADLSPIFRAAVEYRRPLDLLPASDLVGPYQYAFDDVTVRLQLLEDGQGRYVVGQEVMPLTWTLQDAVLTLQMSDDLGPLSTRRLWAQRVPGGLVLVPFGDRAAAPDQLLGQLPPVTTAFAFWIEG